MKIKRAKKVSKILSYYKQGRKKVQTKNLDFSDGNGMDRLNNIKTILDSAVPSYIAFNIQFRKFT